MKMSDNLSPVEDLIEEFKKGNFVILVDDEDRENEGDFIISAEYITPEKMNFMVRNSGGVICVPMSNEYADKLNFPPMISNQKVTKNPNFTISVEAREGVTTGISATDRTTTISKMVKDNASNSDFISPGHVFPIRAMNGGVLRRTGHTESSVDLARLAGLKPVTVISELMHEDGSMMRLPAIIEFARKHKIKIGTVADLVAYRIKSDSFIKPVASSSLQLPWGEFTIYGFKDELNDAEHFAITMGEISGNEPVLTRVHSECFTGDVLGSMRCDCGSQKDAALSQIAQEGRGVFVYLRQEGRGIGILSKLKAYSLQDQGYDTVEANQKLGFGPDLRDYGIGAQILRNLGIQKIKLLTNNPQKIVGLKGYGMEVVDRVPLVVGRNSFNSRYLDTKVERMGHLM